MVNPYLGKTPSEETRKKLSEAKKGKKYNQKSIEKRIITQRIKRNRQIIQFDLQGNRLNSFDSCKEAGEYIGTTTSNICMCLKGKTKTSKGFIWKYETII